MSCNHQSSLGQSIKLGVGLGIGFGVGSAIVETIGPFGILGILLLMFFGPILLAVGLGIFALGAVPFLLVYSLFTGDYSWGPSDPEQLTTVCVFGWLMAFVYVGCGLACLARPKPGKRRAVRDSDLAGDIVALGKVWAIILGASALLGWGLNANDYRESFGIALKLCGTVGALLGIPYLLSRQQFVKGKNWAAAAKAFAIMATITVVLSAAIAYTLQGTYESQETFATSFKNWLGFMMIIAGIAGGPYVIGSLFWGRSPAAKTPGNAASGAIEPPTAVDPLVAKAVADEVELSAKPGPRLGAVAIAIGLGFIVCGFIVGEATGSLGPHIRVRSRFGSP